MPAGMARTTGQAVSTPGECNVLDGKDVSSATLDASGASAIDTLVGSPHRQKQALRVRGFRPRCDSQRA